MIRRRILWKVRNAESEAWHIRYWSTRSQLQRLHGELTRFKERTSPKKKEAGNRETKNALKDPLSEERIRRIDKRVDLVTRFRNASDIRITVARCRVSMESDRKALTKEKVKTLQKRIFVRDVLRMWPFILLAGLSVAVKSCTENRLGPGISQNLRYLELLLFSGAFIVGVRASLKGISHTMAEITNVERDIEKVLDSVLDEMNCLKKTIHGE